MAIHHRLIRIPNPDYCLTDTVRAILGYCFTIEELAIFSRIQESFVIAVDGTLEDISGLKWTLSGTDFYLDPETVRNEGWKCRPLMHFDFEGVVFDYIPLTYREAIDHLLGT